MTQSDQTTKDNNRAQSPKRPNLSRWFWGTIALLFVITICLEFFVARQSDQQGVERDSGSSSDQTETKATRLERSFNIASEEAVKVKEEIGRLLDGAYSPVYAGIPAYMDFHYSLTGEWLELGSAAMGKLGGGLNKYLFDGFDTRLRDVSERLALDFDQKFWSALDDAMAVELGGAGAFEPVVHNALRDSKNRMMKTTGTVGVALVGGGTLKVFTTVFAKKLAIKLAAKVGTKVGVKWATAATGGLASAAACSWTGPGAAACAVVGAAITWVATDVAMIKLDEYVTRDDFERALRELIDDHKIETRRAMEQILDSKLLAYETERKVSVREISLSELKDADRLMACKAAAGILDRYDDIKGNMQARSSANITLLKADLKSQESSHLLAPWIDSMKAAITDPDLRPWLLDPVILTVDFPEELYEGRKIWGELRLAGARIYFNKTKGGSARKYSLRASADKKIVLQGKQRLELELVQGRGWASRNRHFEGSASFDVSENLKEAAGVSPKAAISLTMTPEIEEGPVPQVEVELLLSGAILSGRKLPEFCTQ